MEWKKEGQRLRTWTVKRFLSFVSLAFQGLGGEERADPSQVLFLSSEPSHFGGSQGDCLFFCPGAIHFFYLVFINKLWKMILEMMT